MKFFLVYKILTLQVYIGQFSFNHQKRMESRFKTSKQLKKHLQKRQIHLPPDFQVYCIHLFSRFYIPHQEFSRLYRRVASFWTQLSPSGFRAEIKPADVGLILTGKRGILLQRLLKLRSWRLRWSAADFPEQLPDSLKNTPPSGTCEPLIRTHRTSAANEWAHPPRSPRLSAAHFVWELHPSAHFPCEQWLFLGGGGCGMERNVVTLLLSFYL